MNFTLYVDDVDYDGCYAHIAANKVKWNKISENQYLIDMQFYHTHPYMLDLREYFEEREITFTIDVSFP